MTTATVSVTELDHVERVFCSGGYVLQFSNQTFSEFFHDLGIDIYACYGADSKGKTLRRFLREAPAIEVAKALDALLAHRAPCAGDESNASLAGVRAIIQRLRGTGVDLADACSGHNPLSLAYVNELEEKIDRRISESDLDGAVTIARTMLEEVLRAIEFEMTGASANYEGDLMKRFKSVAKRLRIDDQRPDLDDHFKQVVRGLTQVVAGIAPLRGRLSDAHPRVRKPARHHARLLANAAKTVSLFLIESFAAQRERGLIASASPPTAPARNAQAGSP
jgi:hypothetical protein